MFGRKASRYYDYFDGKEDVPFFRRLMLRLGGPVLDLGCGTGTIALDLAGAGLEVVGVDSSPYMLDIAREKRDKLPPRSRERVRFFEGDMQSFPWEKQFASALLARNSFACLLSTQEQLRCLSHVRNLLAVGGKIVLDLIPPHGEMLQGGVSVGRSVVLDGDIRLLRTVHTRCDLISQLCRQTIIYQCYQGGVLSEQVLEEVCTSLLFPREVLLLLRQTGFAAEEIYGDTGGGQFSAASRRMIVVAGKE